MKYSFSNLVLIRDIKWIMLTLAIGISGQLFISNPIRTLTPKLPMLSHQDWPSSQVASELRVSENWRWPDEREYFIRMQITERHRYDRKAEIEQKTIWYADPSQPEIAVANSLKNISSRWVLTIPPGTDTPTAWLYCFDSFYEAGVWVCRYYAYWGHWYTKVEFWSKGDQYLSPSEMEQFITRVDQLLMAAPDKP